LLLFGTNRTNRLLASENVGELPIIRLEVAHQAETKDALMKNKTKVYVDAKRQAKLHKFVVGDVVLVRQKRTNKFMTKYSSVPHKITAINNSMISVVDDTGREFTRDASRFKLLKTKPSVPVGKQSLSDYEPVFESVPPAVPVTVQLPVQQADDDVFDATQVEDFVVDTSLVTLRRDENNRRKPNLLGNPVSH
jgi:hypothetical protein